MPSPSHFRQLAAAIKDCGFVVRGGFHAQPDDELPAGVHSIVLIGTTGACGFARFRHSHEWGTVSDPMDRYSERVIAALARKLSARVVFPQQGPPWWPFQRWASRAESVFPSPLQILIDPQHGLWHAYRAALMFDSPLVGLPVAATAPQANPCLQCASRPCLSACPVNAFDEHGFDRTKCAEHLRSPAGRACMDKGCAARNACPVAPRSHYAVEQKRFHMQAFFASMSACAPTVAAPTTTRPKPGDE